jgi:hypothetical protein
MGVVIGEILFEGRAPMAAAIAKAVTDQCGLPVLVAESDATVKASLYDMHARFAFECAPELKLEVFSYLPGEVRTLYNSITADAAPLLRRQLKVLKGLDEPEGHQAVHLRAHVGQDLSLFWVTTLALERLGGRGKRPVSPEVQAQYGGALTPALLKQRIHKTHWLMLAAGVGWFLVLPFNLVILFLHALATPWRVWRSYRTVRKELDEQERGGGPTMD